MPSTSTMGDILRRMRNLSSKRGALPITVRPVDDEALEKSVVVHEKFFCWLCMHCRIPMIMVGGVMHCIPSTR